MSNSVLVAAAQLNIFNTNALNFEVIKKLKEFGVDIRIFIPMDRKTQRLCIQEFIAIDDIALNIGDIEIKAEIKEGEYEGIKIYALDMPEYFDMDNIYDQTNEAEKFSCFCRGILKALPIINFKPEIIQCEDWPTAFVPFILKEKYKDITFYDEIKTIFTFNNVGNQGIFDIDTCRYLDITRDELASKGLDYYEQVNFMKAGLLYADKITTVSTNYVKDISSEMFGNTLENIINMRQEDICGILTGIDNDSNNPQTDQRIYVNYSIDSIEGKLQNKKLLQKKLGFEVNDDIPLIFFNSSLSCEKGIDLIQYSLSDIMKDNVQMIIMSTKTSCEEFEEEILEEFLQRATERYSDKFLYIPFDESMLYKCFAGADIFLMPSAIEPCGFGQLVAMRYGAVPLVKEVGGFIDTVKFFENDMKNATGFSFKYSNEKVLLYTIRRAIEVYKNKEVWINIQKNCMSQDFQIDKYIKEYIQLYSALVKERYCIC